MQHCVIRFGFPDVSKEKVLPSYWKVQDSRKLYGVISSFRQITGGILQSDTATLLHVITLL